MGFGPRIKNRQHSVTLGVALGFLCAIVTVFTTIGARASDECEATEPKTDSACNNPNDTTTGDESGQMTKLADDFKSAGSSTGNIGNNQANQCENQQKVQDLSRQLSQLKGKACENMINKCAETCEKEAKDNDSKADQYQSTNPGLAQQHREKARKKREVKSRCEKNMDNVAKAAEQAGQNADRAGTNSQCNQQSSQQPEQPQQQQQDEKPSPTPAPTPTPPLNCLLPSNASNPACPQAGKIDSDSNKIGMFSGGGSEAAAGGSAAGGLPGAGSSAASYTEGSSQAALGSSDGSGGGGGGDFGSLGSSASASTSQDEAEEKAARSGDGFGVGGGGGGGRGGGGPGNMPPDPHIVSMKRKGLAGMTVKAVDGITGPMGDSLFEKVSQQYKRQMSNLLHE